MANVKGRAKSGKVTKDREPEVVRVDHVEPDIPESVCVKNEESGTIYGLSATLSAMCDEALEDISELSGVLARGSFVVETAELPDNLIDRLGVVEKKLNQIIESIADISHVVGK